MASRQFTQFFTKQSRRHLHRSLIPTISRNPKFHGSVSSPAITSAIAFLRSSSTLCALNADPQAEKGPTLGKYATPSRYLSDDPANNITPHIASLVGRDLHLRTNHPIGIIRSKIQEYFQSLGKSANVNDGTNFQIFNAEDPIVTTTQCFDDLLIPPNHPGRSPSDTYYVTPTTLLRTHTSAHQSQHLRNGWDAFLCCGDVYRRDEIDATHYPAFHQMEGVKLLRPELVKGAVGLTGDDWLNSPECALIEEDLKMTLEGLMDQLFGSGTTKRWNADYFPFTSPSFELEIYHNDEWMEVLGCGVIHEGVLNLSGRGDRRGWAFGLGLERLAMILFSIPDIRLFWTEDERFHSQFQSGEIVKFKSYSKYPPVFKDIAFWTASAGRDEETSRGKNSNEFVENDFFDLVRSTAGDLVERIELIDAFTHPKTGRSSRCYRISYRSMDRSLTNEEIDHLQFKIRDECEGALGCELR
mmetsp:Transcript_22527/g.43021  ORF Transcript_22527/g.43021 Transcript_22527/m.43021 type:complete len:470 (+) Transcript_22527:197-1606(+)